MSERNLLGGTLSVTSAAHTANHIGTQHNTLEPQGHSEHNEFVLHGIRDTWY